MDPWPAKHLTRPGRQSTDPDPPFKGVILSRLTLCCALELSYVYQAIVDDVTNSFDADVSNRPAGHHFPTCQARGDKVERVASPPPTTYL